MSRATILAAIRANQPESLPHPGAYSAPTVTDLDALFTERLALAGGQAQLGTAADRLEREILGAYATDARCFSYVSGISSTVAAPANDNEFATLDVAVLPGTLAVAENGAVWVAFFDDQARRASLLANDVVLIVPRGNLVATMHDAMRHPDFLASSHHQGAFLSGPSKTADIEQCLVIGAHGPCSMRVFLV